MCSFASQAGLFSAVTSAFILDVQSQLQPDTGQETAALLRVLIDKIDNTTFGNNTPALPQWTGPPRAIVQVQTTLYMSLTISLLSAFLAMLSKQWLNRYASTDMRGTAVQRSQDRQRKLDGIIAWGFEDMMECLPLMLQFALLFLGYALSQYLREINTDVAFVVVHVTWFGLAFYVFIAIAGTAFESCPYQTPVARTIRRFAALFLSHHQLVTDTVSMNVLYQSPGARLLRHIVRHALPVLVSSRCYRQLVWWWSSFQPPWYSAQNIFLPFLLLPGMLIAAAMDAYRLGRAILRLWVLFGKILHRWVVGILPQTGASDQQTITLGFRCVSWMLQTSLDKIVHLSALKHLSTVRMKAELSPTIAVDCLNVFLGCVDIGDHTAMIKDGSEQLAAVSVVCLVRALRRLSVTDPTSNVLEIVRLRVGAPPHVALGFTDLRPLYLMPKVRDLPPCYMVAKVYDYLDCERPDRLLVDDEPFAQGPIPAARDMAEAARLEYQQTEPRKVPRWILRFALHSLSLDPLPPTSVIVDCLSIIATDLGCDVADARFMTSDERYVRFLQVITTLTLN